MPTPALDNRPDTDSYTQGMVDAYSYIQKGSNENGTIPISEIFMYYLMFEDLMFEDRQDFVYLITVMNQPMLDIIKERMEKGS